MTENSEPPTAHSPTRSDWQASAIPNWRRWMLVGLLFFAALINYLDRATISVALPRISGDLLLGPTAKGVLLSSFFWSYALMQVPIGWLADRVSLRWLYAGSFALWSLACGFTYCFCIIYNSVSGIVRNTKSYGMIIRTVVFYGEIPDCDIAGQKQCRSFCITG